MAIDPFAEAESVTPLRGAMLRCGLTGAQTRGSGNILLIGEMIGATFPFTGEGIGKAMESGEIAAEVTHQALESGDFSLLGEYAKRLQRELKPKYLGYQLAEDWLSNPRLNDFVARRINRSSYLHRSVTGVVNETISPKAVFSLRGVLRSFFS
jgi:flavin-dependent dehydrogenase